MTGTKVSIKEIGMLSVPTDLGVTDFKAIEETHRNIN